MPTILKKDISPTNIPTFTGKIKSIQRGAATGQGGDTNTGIVTVSINTVDTQKCTVTIYPLGLDWYVTSATGSDDARIPYVSNFTTNSFTISDAYTRSARPTNVYYGRAFVWEIVEYE